MHTLNYVGGKATTLITTLHVQSTFFVFVLLTENLALNTPQIPTGKNVLSL